MNPSDNQLTAEQRAHRDTAFDIWLAKSAGRLGFHRLGIEGQHAVRYMLRKAWNAGTNYEARMAAEECDQ